MLNYLRADLYRLRRSGVAAGVLLFIVGFCLFFIGMNVVIALSAGEPISGVDFPNALDTTAEISFLSGFLPLFASYAPTYLIASDWKAGGFKTVLAGSGARSGYAASKVAVGALFTLVIPGVMLACFGLVPWLLGMHIESVASASQLLMWWGLASLVGFAYTVVCTLCAILSRGETLAWVSTMFVGLGIVGNGFMLLFGMVAAFLPPATGFAQIAIDNLLYAQAMTLGNGASFVTQDAGTLVHTALVAGGWAVAAGALGWIVFRRKTL